jgi:phage-related protein
VSSIKPLYFVGSSLEDLRSFPSDVRRLVGENLRRVQMGLMPSDFKPMPAVGKGAYEIRVRSNGAWRVIYVAKFEDAVYVLHGFQKKTQRTARDDIAVAQKRYQSAASKE